MSSARAMITGGFGFVGVELCRALVEDGQSVAVLDDLSVGSEENLADGIAHEVETLVADVRDLEAVAAHILRFRPSTLFHLAAVHFIPTCENQPALAIGVNVAGTQAVLDASSRSDSVEALIVASSAAVYEPAAEAHAETDRIGPTDIYGYSKAWTEDLTTYFHQRTGIPVGIARLFNVIGPGETNAHLLPAIIEQIQKDARLRLGNLTTSRDYVFTSDVAAGFVRLADACRADGSLTCNLGSESSFTGAELVELVARITGREVSIERDPDRVRESDRPMLLSDCRRAHEVLGWRAETGIEDAIVRALAQPFAKGFKDA